MPLKIPAGFAVTYNNFYDVLPEMPEDPDDDIIKNWSFFTEDLLQIVMMDLKKGSYSIPDEHLLIDLGWYPDSDPKGEYYLQLVKVKRDRSWEEIKDLSSADRYLIKRTIEEWMKSLHNNSI
ncbi:hypothetical protein [Brevibacillus migulae]|uniref:hypothetical protein n=1 Tax=Brevibacillus migulae TaxID=1644114 RepID=UPI001F3D1098|nr:hypothetical protein [Brevibacillus migulae]